MGACNTHYCVPVPRPVVCGEGGGGGHMAKRDVYEPHRPDAPGPNAWHNTGQRGGCTGEGKILYGGFSAGENSARGIFRTCPKNQGENSAPPKS